MNRIFPGIIFAVFVVAGGQRAWADWGIHWKTFDLDVHVNNTGAVHVVERDDVALSGGAAMLERKFALGTDQTMVLKRFVREDAAGEHELIEGDARQPDRYYWYNGALSWGVKSEGTESGEQTVVYRIEYDLRNALAPAWDIPAGKRALVYHPHAPSLWERTQETLAAWRRDSGAITRRFRLDHDVLFATEFPATGPEDVHYVLKYDNAWRLVAPNEAMGTVHPNEDYRVTRMFEYLPDGWPPAIEWWRPAARMGSIAVVALLALCLSIFLVIWEVWKRGLSSPRIDGRWLEERIARQRPEILAWLLDRPDTGVSVAYFLDRMRAAGVLTVQTEPRVNEADDPKVRLRLLNQDAALEPYERLSIAALFPNGAESGSDVLAKHYAQPGFDPHEVLQTAIDTQYGVEEQPTFFVWRLAWYVVLLCLIVGTALILHATLVGNSEWRVLFQSLAIGPCLAIVPVSVRRFLNRNRNGLTALVSVAWAGVAVFVFFALHMLANKPHSVEGSVGLAVYWTWCLIVLILGARTIETPALARQKADAEIARNYALDQLRLPHPGLDDAWIPQLRALQLSPQIAEWSRLHGSHATLNTSAYHFTGILEDGVDMDWARAISVLPPAAAKDTDDEDDSDDEEAKR